MNFVNIESGLVTGVTELMSGALVCTYVVGGWMNGWVWLCLFPDERGRVRYFGWVNSFERAGREDSRGCYSTLALLLSLPPRTTKSTTTTTHQHNNTSYSNTGATAATIATTFTAIATTFTAIAATASVSRHSHHRSGRRAATVELVIVIIVIAVTTASEHVASLGDLDVAKDATIGGSLTVSGSVMGSGAYTGIVHCR
jgi:hypothetical protein